MVSAPFSLCVTLYISSPKNIYQKEKGNTSMPTAAYTVYDIETTGLSAACQCEIIEFAGIKLDEDLKEIGRLHVYVKPYNKLPKKIVELTGITNEMLSGADNRFVMLPKIRAFIGDTISVCHNSQFDFSFISTMCLQQGLPILKDHICTMKSYKAITGEKTAKLAAACERFGIELKHAHTAIADVEATVKLFRALCDYDDGQGRSKLCIKRTDDKKLFISLMSAICSQNPNKKTRDLLCAVPSSKKSGAESYNEVNPQTVFNFFEAAKDPLNVCDNTGYDFNVVSEMFALWLNNKRMPRFVYLEDTQINRQIRAMIERCGSLSELIEMHKKVYDTDQVNIGAYTYFWRKNKSLFEDEVIAKGLMVLFCHKYPIEKIIEVCPHIHPCTVALEFCRFAENNKSKYHQYIAESLCNKGDMEKAIDNHNGHFTDDEISANPALIKVAVTCTLFERNFFAINKS